MALTAEEFNYFRKQAGQGDLQAQFVIAGAYHTGNGVGRDLVEGTRWLLKAAEQGHIPAQFCLACAYYDGTGVARNPVEGARLLLKAAEQGYVSAQCNLGVMYLSGTGVEQSYPDAIKWLRKAAGQDDALAQHSLGTVYAKGFRDKSVGFFDRVRYAHMTRDYVEAYKWFTLAAKNGHAPSLKDRAFIKKMWMKDYQIARAEQLVREFEQARTPADPLVREFEHIRGPKRDGAS